MSGPAEQFVAELCEVVNEGGWGEVLQGGLDNESIEILRVLRQLNGDITKLEAREKELSDALVTRLMPFDFDDGTEPEPATPAPDPMADLQIGRKGS